MGSRYSQAPRFSGSRSSSRSSARSEAMSRAATTTLGRLFRFYAECVDAEERRNLSLRLSGFHKSFVSPWEDGVPETILSASAVEGELPPLRESDGKFLRKGQLDVGDAAALFYGYPVIIDIDDFIAPLFFISVEVAWTGGERARLRVPDTNAVQLNRHVFRRARFPLEELAEIQEELEGSFGSFAARLRAAFELLNVASAFDASDNIESFPEPGTASERWIRRGMLFRSERSLFTANLRRELDALMKYDRLQRAVPETALGALLEPESDHADKVGHSSVCQIMPLNDAQHAAAQAGLSDRITVITGPPGTGKSQVIVDILATCARDGRSILFASKNNKAVDVVSERLQSLLGADDWTLRLGNRDYVNKAREDLHSRLTGEIRETSAITPVSARESLIIVRALDDRRRHVATALDRYRDAVAARRRLEFATQESWRELAPPADLKHIRQLHATAYFDALALAGREPLSIWLSLERLFAPQRQRRRLSMRAAQIAQMLGPLFAMPSPSGGVDTILVFLVHVKAYLDWLAALRHEDDLRAEVDKLETIAPLEKELRDARAALSAASIIELARSWTGKIHAHAAQLNGTVTRYFAATDALYSGPPRSGADFVDMLENAVGGFKKLVASLPVWVVTSLSARRGIPLAPGLFDLLIVDEASQCDIASAIPLLFRAKQAVIIGDPMQLNHISALDYREEAQLRDQIGVQEQWNKGWTYTSHSLYKLAELLENERGRKPHFLSEHYRSDASIIGFSNRVFYGGRLVVRTDRERLAETGFETGVFWHDVRGFVPPGARSANNPDEISAIVDLLRLWAPRLGANPTATIGIVTPFRRQMEMLESAISGSGMSDDITSRIRVGTAHRFQGDECDIMVFSPVVAQGMAQRLMNWVAHTDQLLNVAVTRARAALHIVGDLEAAREAGGALAELAAHVHDVQPDETKAETPEEREVAELLTAVGLYYRSQLKVGKYRLDFEVVSPFGTRWALELDGSQHLDGDALDRDEARDSFLRDAGYKVARISNRHLWREPKRVKALLERLY